MKSPPLRVWVVLVLILGVQLFGLLHTDFASSDHWERARVSQAIVAGKADPVSLPMYEGNPLSTYPPLFDQLMAGIQFGTGWEYLDALRLMSVLLLIPFLLLTYVIAKEFMGEGTALLAPFTVLMIPRIFRIAFQPLPEFLGLVLLLAGVYAVLKKEYWITGVLLAILSLVHFRAFANTALIVFLFVAIQYRRQWKESATLLLLPKIYLLPAIVFLGYYAVLNGPLSVHSVENPFVAVWPSWMVLGIPLLLALVGLYLQPQWKKEWFIPGLLVVYFLIATIGMISGHPVFAFRELTYAFLPVAVLAASGMGQIRQRYGLAVLGLVVLAMMSGLLYVNLPITDPINATEQEAIVWAGMHTEEPALMGGFVANYAIPYLTDKKIVAGAFLEGVKDSEERIADMKQFWVTPDAEEAVRIMDKYHAGTVVVTRFELRQWYPIQVNTEKFHSPLFTQTRSSLDAEVYQLAE